MSVRSKPSTDGTQSPSHDFFDCVDCLAAGNRLMDSVRKIRRWADALINTEILPHSENADPVLEALVHAIAYEAQDLEMEVPTRALCSEEWERQVSVRHGPKAVQS